MRLNVSKSKVMHFRTCAATPPPVITIGNSPLGAVEVYKYLGFHITNTFDSSQQWLYIKPLISKNIYLINQLASIGLNVKILVNVFKSLVLSQLRYRSTVLISCTNRIKSDIQVLQVLQLPLHTGLVSATNHPHPQHPIASSDSQSPSFNCETLGLPVHHPKAEHRELHEERGDYHARPPA